MYAEQIKSFANYWLGAEDVTSKIQKSRDLWRRTEKNECAKETMEVRVVKQWPEQRCAVRWGVLSIRRELSFIDI